MIDEKKIIIFGASVGGVKVLKMLKGLGIECQFIVDNSENKWGTYLEGIMVKNPRVLKETDYYIVIASVYQEEIEKQLQEMKISAQRIITREQCVKDFLDSNMEQYREIFKNYRIAKRDRSVILDLDHGLLVGGIESWSFLVAKECIEEKINTVIYTDKTIKKVPYHLEKITRHMDVSKIDFIQEIIDIAKNMIFLAPCLFIANWMEQSFWAAYILKQLYPNDIYILGMVHHDMLCYYRRNQYIEKIVDNFLCVSQDTKKRMVKEFSIPKEKVHYTEVPICFSSNYKKDKNMNQTIRIGLGSRLDKAKKRVDLLIPLIESLQRLNVTFQLKIAGDGSYYSELSHYIEKKSLANNVILLGEVQISDMEDFWKTCDIVISTSDSEGMGLSILEGMAWENAPVVTDTAGIRHFIHDNENGYVVPIGDIELMAKQIKELDDNRELLAEFARKSKQVIVDKCSVKKYVMYINNLTNNTKD